jgi:hypothetical protein
VNLWSLLTYVYVLILLVILPFSRSFEKWKGKTGSVSQ